MSDPVMVCKQGHPLSGENLYVKTKPDGSLMRQCRECERIRLRLRSRQRPRRPRPYLPRGIHNKAARLEAEVKELRARLQETEDYRDGFAADLDHAEERLAAAEAREGNRDICYSCEIHTLKIEIRKLWETFAPGFKAAYAWESQPLDNTAPPP